MSQRLWLIVEDENDGMVVRHLLAKKGFVISVEIISPTGGSGGISRLAAQLGRLIETIRKDKRFDQRSDSIAVLHDQDEQTQQRYRSDHNIIKEACVTHGVKLGCVDISSKPNQHADKLQKAQVSLI